MDFTILAPAGETAFLVMGRQKESAVVLERRTIKLDGKPDSWEGIEPSFQTETGSFLGARGNGVQRIYVCRDDRYFYWRIDFFEETLSGRCRAAPHSG